jgi:periplasmic protein TonB
VFRIDAPIDEGRSEPLLAPDPAMAALPPRLSPTPIPVAADSPAQGRREPAIPIASPLPPGASLFPERERPVGSDLRKHPFGSIGSLVLHLLPLLLLLDWPMHPPAEITAIPVQLVFEPPPPPPPPPKPAPKQRLKPETRPPPGRIASQNMGDTQTKGHDQAKSDEPTPDKEPATTEESPLEAPQQTAFLPPPPLLPAPPELTLPKPPKPPAKPSATARQPLRRAPQRGHLMPRPARFPGPAATRDEYLAYLAALARQHIGLLSPSLLDGRRGETIINVLVLDDGTVAMLSVGKSSGYPDIDVRVEEMIRAVGRFPPLPQWFQGPRMPLEFLLRFPEALDD